MKLQELKSDCGQVIAFEKSNCFMWIMVKSLHLIAFRLWEIKEILLLLSVFTIFKVLLKSKWCYWLYSIQYIIAYLFISKHVLTSVYSRINFQNSLKRYWVSQTRSTKQVAFNCDSIVIHDSIVHDPIVIVNSRSLLATFRIIFLVLLNVKPRSKKTQIRH